MGTSLAGALFCVIESNDCACLEVSRRWATAHLLFIRGQQRQQEEDGVDSAEAKAFVEVALKHHAAAVSAAVVESNINSEESVTNAKESKEIKRAAEDAAAHAGRICAILAHLLTSSSSSPLGAAELWPTALAAYKQHASYIRAMLLPLIERHNNDSLSLAAAAGDLLSAIARHQQQRPFANNIGGEPTQQQQQQQQHQNPFGSQGQELISSIRNQLTTTQCPAWRRFGVLSAAQLVKHLLMSTDQLDHAAADARHIAGNNNSNY